MNIPNEYINDEIKNAIRITQEFGLEINYHILMLETFLKYESENGICIVSQKK